MLVTERAGRLRMVPSKGGSTAPSPGVPEVTRAGRAGCSMSRSIRVRRERARLSRYAEPRRGDERGGPAPSSRAAGSTAPARGRAGLFRQSRRVAAATTSAGARVRPRGLPLLTLGDARASATRAGPDDHAGSVIRLHDDGRVPNDNPFVGSAGWKPESWTSATATSRARRCIRRPACSGPHEHGPQGGDEVNVIRAGHATTAGRSSPTARTTASAPRSAKARTRTAWSSRSTTGCRRSRPRAWPSTPATFPGWKGNLFVGALRDQMLVRLRSTARRW